MAAYLFTIGDSMRFHGENNNILRNLGFLRGINAKTAMIDRLDAKILNILRQNNRITVDQLCAEVGLSPSACQRRMSRLRADQVIRGDIAVVDPARVGKKLTMIIDVTLEREKTEWINRFKETMRAHPQVMQCYYVVQSPATDAP